MSSRENEISPGDPTRCVYERKQSKSHPGKQLDPEPNKCKMPHQFTPVTGENKQEYKV
jgi:hypothetical protein